MWKKLTDKKARVMIAKVEEPFKGLPHLPQSPVDFFVKITNKAFKKAFFLTLYFKLPFLFGKHNLIKG